MSGCSIVSFHKLTSDLSGVVTIKGKPVDGAKVIFRANSHWYGEWEVQELVTTEGGKFQIPQWRKVRPFVLIHQPVIEQDITIEYEGTIYKGWNYTRMSYSDKHDSDSFLKCDLNEKISTQKISSYETAKGICVAE